MSKITKKLFRYFAVLSLFLSAIVFLGFYGAFRYSHYHYQEETLKERARTIQAQLEEFLDSSGPRRGQGAYLKFLDDISMADTYLIDQSQEIVFCGSHAESEKEPSGKILAVAGHVFASEQEWQLKEWGRQGKRAFYLGLPIKKNDKISAALVVHGTLDVEGRSFFMAVTILGCCLFFALAASGVLSAFLARRFMSPIQKIAAATRELTKGNYQAKTEVYDKNEIGELARETDMLAEKLDAAARERKALEQMQKDYIANISHELRTPVAVIRSSLEAVCDGVVSGDKRREYQEQCLNESISLQRLVNDMLELSRLQNKDFPIEKAELDLLLALDDALRAIRILAEAKNIRLDYSRPESEWRLNGDYGRLRQMFTAALDNAVKYSPYGSQIRIKAWEASDGYGISIKDEGSGIPEEEQRHIFEKFFRSKMAAEKGSGLGLAIMKSIADRHSIGLEIQSACGAGTDVRFTVPLGRF